MQRRLFPLHLDRGVNKIPMDGQTSEVTSMRLPRFVEEGEGKRWGAREVKWLTQGHTGERERPGEGPASNSSHAGDSKPTLVPLGHAASRETMARFREVFPAFSLWLVVSARDVSDLDHTV